MATSSLGRSPAFAFSALLTGSLVFIGSAWAQGGPPAPGAPAPAASGSASRPGANPPPYMYEEPLPPEERLPAPSAAPAPAAPPKASSAAPKAAPPPGPPPPPPPGYAPYYVYEPLPPPPMRHRAPVNSLWLGGRGGVLFPSGALYDQIDTTQSTRSYQVVDPEPWSDIAGNGPVFELDVGGRFSRHYIIYGLWEHAFLGAGGALLTFGDPTSASTDLAGVGFRWSSNPDEVGIVVDLGLGYRWFRESWADGTKLDMQGLGETRIGVGADIRVADRLSLSPLFALSVGEFNIRRIHGPGIAGSGIGDYSDTHSTVTLTLGVHYDLAP